jgi:hypothetical protein
MMVTRAAIRTPSIHHYHEDTKNHDGHEKRTVQNNFVAFVNLRDIVMKAAR